MNNFEPCMEPGTGQDFRQDWAVAMAYVPWQHFRNTYDPEKALMVGTIFPELDKPFTGRKPGGRK